MGGGFRGRKGEEVKGSGSTDGSSQDRHRDVKNSTGSTVDTVVITTLGARWVPDLAERSLSKFHDV